MTGAEYMVILCVRETERNFQQRAYTELDEETLVL